MTLLRSIFTASSLVFFLASCAQEKSPDPDFKPFEEDNSLSVMTYNTENLFDTLDDAEKMDEAYLPLTVKQSQAHKDLCLERNPEPGFRQNQCLNMDWSEERVREKARRLAEVISSADPDIVILQEIENINALNILNQAFGKKAFPTAILLEGPDQRGVDVAVLSRLEAANSQKHRVPLVKENLGDRPTRSILQVDLKLKSGEILTVFGVHFPAPYNPIAHRELAFETLLKAYGEVPEQRMVIAAGDFNVTSQEDSESKILRKYMDRSFVASHKVGCEKCPGTAYYHHTAPEFRWSFLDIAFISRNMVGMQASASMRLSEESINIHVPQEYQNNRFGNPAHFLDSKLENVRGVSDHWPLVFDLLPR